MKASDIGLSDKMRKELRKLKKHKAQPDAESPEITSWENAVLGKYFRPIKKQITVRIDADVLEWFRHATSKYQTLINQACREYMRNHGKSNKEKRV